MAFHKDAPEDNIHEPKGQSLLTAGAGDIGKVNVSKGDGTTETRKLTPAEIDNSGGTLTRMGFIDYNNTEAAVTLSTADTFFQLTNDGLGPNTNKTYSLVEVTELFNTTTDQFDFTQLTLGDVCDIRIDMLVTTTGANHEVELQIDIGIGDAGNYQLHIHRENFKVAGTYNIVKMFSIYMGDITTKDFPAELKIKTDTGTTDSAQLNGFFIETTTNSTLA